MTIKYLRTSSIKNKTVLLRPDLNCPVEDGKVMDDFRIEESLATIELLLQNKNKLIICGHLGRPKGQWKKEFSFKPVAEVLARQLHLPFVATEHKIALNHPPRLVFYTGNLLESIPRKQIQNIPSKASLLAPLEK